MEDTKERRTRKQIKKKKLKERRKKAKLTLSKDTRTKQYSKVMRNLDLSKKFLTNLFGQARTH